MILLVFCSSDCPTDDQAAMFTSHCDSWNTKSSIQGVIFHTINAANGGAIWWDNRASGSITVDSCCFTLCTASDTGGALYFSKGKSEVKQCVGTSCSAVGTGGFAYAYGLLQQSAFESCTADGYGGIITMPKSDNNLCDRINVTSCSSPGYYFIDGRSVDLEVAWSFFCRCEESPHWGIVHTGGGGNKVVSVDHTVFLRCDSPPACENQNLAAFTTCAFEDSPFYGTIVGTISLEQCFFSSTQAPLAGLTTRNCFFSWTAVTAESSTSGRCWRYLPSLDFPTPIASARATATWNATGSPNITDTPSAWFDRSAHDESLSPLQSGFHPIQSEASACGASRYWGHSRGFRSVVFDDSSAACATDQYDLSLLSPSQSLFTASRCGDASLDWGVFTQFQRAPLFVDATISPPTPTRESDDRVLIFGIIFAPIFAALLVIIGITGFILWKRFRPGSTSSDVSPSPHFEGDAFAT